MDFNKEMYKRREREKQRAKSKVQYTMDVACEVSLSSLMIYILSYSFKFDSGKFKHRSFC